MKTYPIRVLVIIPGLNVCGGMESFIMNYFRNIDRSTIVFDFITHDISENSYKDEIFQLGGKIYKLPRFSVSNIKFIKKEYEKILKRNDYRIIHCNMANAAFIYLKIAQKFNIPVRILHSHQDKASDNLLHALRNFPLIRYGVKFSNVNIACSKQAGQYLFRKNDYTIINNAIDYSKYTYKDTIREHLRKQFKLEDKFVIGHTGRLTAQKNQEFLIDIFLKIKEKKDNAHLLLIGEGEDRNKLERKINDYNLEKAVTFLGSRKDIDNLLQVIDLFIFPSLYEGLGISLLEAQAASLICFCSETIPKEVDISGNVHFLSLKKSSKEWGEYILNIMEIPNKRTPNIQLNKNYDIKNNSKVLLNLYLSNLKELDK